MPLIHWPRPNHEWAGSEWAGSIEAIDSARVFGLRWLTHTVLRNVGMECPFWDVLDLEARVKPLDNESRVASSVAEVDLPQPMFEAIVSADHPERILGSAALNTPSSYFRIVGLRLLDSGGSVVVGTSRIVTGD